jgi:hypothetical protein
MNFQGSVYLTRRRGAAEEHAEKEERIRGKKKRGGSGGTWGFAEVHFRLIERVVQGRCGGRGLRVFAVRIPAASDLVGIYEDVGTVLMTLSTSSVPSF